jgi:hypothetical protein
MATVYISFFFRKALYITDRDDKFLSLLFKVPEEYQQMLKDAIEHIHAVLPGEFKDDDSRRAAFKYLSCHYSWYARYGEKVRHTISSYFLTSSQYFSQGTQSTRRRTSQQCPA